MGLGLTTDFKLGKKFLMDAWHSGYIKNNIIITPNYNIKYYLLLQWMK
jgi:hypothetical protein